MCMLAAECILVLSEARNDNRRLFYCPLPAPWNVPSYWRMQGGSLRVRRDISSMMSLHSKNVSE
jgi:hypothetical protein